MNRIFAATKIVLICAFSFLFFSCGATWVPYAGTTTYQVANDPDRVYAATIRVFLRRGYGFQARDPVAHAVETEYFLQERFPGRYGVLVSFRVIASQGRVEIFTSCRMSDGFSNRTCAPNERLPGTAETEQEIVQEILREVQSL